MANKSYLLQETKRVGYDGCYILIVPDHGSGHRNRFTVYRVPASPSRPIKIIGFELPLGFAKKIARKEMF